jgi:uncharacterized protein (TIGR03083 family)
MREPRPGYRSRKLSVVNRRVQEVEKSAYIRALRRHGTRLADAAIDLTRPVPACPGWNVAELVWHTGEVHASWRHFATGGTFENRVDPLRPADADIVEWFRSGVEATASLLEGLDPEQPAWSWAPQKNVGFIQRRMAQETAVHCWDALAAAGLDEPLERDLAVDGIDELLAFFLSEVAPAGVDVHLHCTDGHGEWLIRADEGSWRIGREHAKAAVAVRGTASDLLLVLWRRKPLTSVETFGDPAALDKFLTTAELD